MLVALIDEDLVERREQLQDERLLAAIAHRAEAPNLALGEANSAGNFDIEFVEQLVANLRIIDARGNLYGGHGDQAILRLLDERMQLHRAHTGNQRLLVRSVALPARLEPLFQADASRFPQSIN